MTTSSEFKSLSPPVEVDEMGFAIALFVAAANGQVNPPSSPSPEYSLTGKADGYSDALLLGAKAILTEEDVQIPAEIPLARAVSVIWAHYELDARQQAICARLVAFYSLMLRTRGALLGAWTEESDRDPQSITLAPAIVEAVATASIGENGQFIDVNFRGLVQSLAERDGEKLSRVELPVARKSVARKVIAPLPVSEVVEQLSLHLFAFQACVTGMHDGHSLLRFHVVEQLSSGVVIIGGGGSLQIMLARALAANVANFPWLDSVTASKDGSIEGLDQIQPTALPREAMKGELAVLGSFIELLRLFLGDAVTLQILRNLWPLAVLNQARADGPK